MFIYVLHPLEKTINDLKHNINKLTNLENENKTQQLKINDLRFKY